MKKNKLRKKYSKLRDSLDYKEKNRLDEEIFDYLVNSRVYIESKVVFTYISFKSEVDSLRICQHAINSGKTLLIPKVFPKEKEMKSIILEDMDQLESLEYGIKSIKNSNIYHGPIDLMITPLLAIDKEGFRLGYGGGYYDRFMEKRQVNKSLGLSYSFQVTDKLPHEPWDMKLDYYISEDGLKRIED